MIKFYKNSTEFERDNNISLNANINSFDSHNYCIKVEDKDYRIFAICSNDVLKISGNFELANELAECIFISNLSFTKLILENDLLLNFISFYSTLSHGKFDFISICEYEYHKGSIDRALFAGGCFWCIANAFYNIEGVIEVYSGYSGGDVFFPSYYDVKGGATGHKEAIYIIYDQNKISYYDLLVTFFENIDPFDNDGQFIDRGSSYTTAVFTSDEIKKNLYYKIKTFIETKYQRQISVHLFNDSVFFLAEDEHQRFSLNNKEKFEHEEEISGRNTFCGVKISNNN